MMEQQTDAGIENVKDAIEQLSEKKGQTYINADYAFDLLRPFYGHQTAYHIPFDDAGHQKSLGEIVYDIAEHPSEARGMVFIPQYQMAVVVAHLTRHIAENLMGVDPVSKSQFAGAGFSADAEHEGNMARIKEAFGLDSDEDEE